MALWEDVQEFASGTWDQVQGGLEQWVGIEIAEEVDGLNDTSSQPSSHPGMGERTTGSPPATDQVPGAIRPFGDAGPTLQTVALVAGLLASGVFLYQAVKG